MRKGLSAIFLAVLAAGAWFSFPTAQAQGRGAMWCSAIAGNGSESTYYYSRVFSASPADARSLAVSFKSAVEDAEISASSVTATCHAAPDADTAEQALSAAMERHAGETLDWSPR